MNGRLVPRRPPHLHRNALERAASGTRSALEEESIAAKQLDSAMKNLAAIANEVSDVTAKLAESYAKRAELITCVTSVARVPPPLTLDPNVTELALKPGQSMSVTAIGDPKATRIGDWQSTIPTDVSRSFQASSPDRTQFTFRAADKAVIDKGYPFVITEISGTTSRSQAIIIKTVK